MALAEQLLEQPDFVFGPLSSDAQRLEFVRAARRGVTHSRVPRDARPGEPVVIELDVGPARDEPVLTVEGERVELERGHVEWDTLIWGYVRRFRATVPGRPANTVVRYAVDSDEFAYCVDDYEPPEWARNSVVYHVFVDRFDPGPGREWGTEPFMGGTLAGVTRRLDYIRDLGCDALWLSPLFPSPTYHGYDATDLFAIEPRLGTMDDFRRLVDAAHERGIRVLLDFVPNHWSTQHPTFVDAVKNRDSAYRDWYLFDRWPDRYESFFGAGTMPKVNLLDEGARGHTLEGARHWLELGVDGFRVDHATGPAQPFWAHFRLATKAARDDCWTFAEAVETPAREREFEGVLDGCLDFTLLEAFRKTFAEGVWDGVRFWRFIDAHSRFFSPESVRPSFLDNHDMNRFLWVAGNDKRRLELAAFCQFTLEGPPVVYYGTEVGMSQLRDVRETSDREARLPMAWDDVDDSLVALYRDLSALRRRGSDVWRAGREAVVVEPDLLVYRVGGRVTVALNLGEDARTYEGTKLEPLSGTILDFDGEEAAWRR
jgi:cyclomaltodextrinase / maltogenic alpha-amylase / neopullulanase